jgi:protein-disulfide isomerase
MKCCPITSFFNRDNSEKGTSQKSSGSCGGCFSNSNKIKYCVKVCAVSFVVSFATVKIFTKKEVASFINNNPKSIIESIENMYKKEKEKAQAEATKKIPEVVSSIMSNSQLPFIGNPNGKNVVIEFFDYSCGYCKKQAQEINALISKDKDTKVIMVDFPIMSQVSLLAAQVGLHVFEKNKDKFEKYYLEVSTAKSLTNKTIEDIVIKLGFSKQIVSAAQEDKDYRAILEKNYSYAKELSLQGTPALIIKGKLIPGFSDVTEIRRILSSN